MKPDKKVIRASAGTGKTYRLSLEFVNLLIKYRDYKISFDEILVITFTNKATAEIQQRILKHLKTLVSENSELSDNQLLGKDILLKNIKNINPDFKFSDRDKNYLKTIYQKMLLNKNRINISTIDSFVHKIFQELLAPLHNITDFKIDNNINEELFPEIFEYLLQEKNRDKFKKIATVNKSRNLEKYEDLIKDIIKYRWFFSHMELRNSKDTEEVIKFKSFKESSLLDYKDYIRKLFDEIQTFAIGNGVKHCHKIFNRTKLRRLIQKYVDLKDVPISELSDTICDILCPKNVVCKEYESIIASKEFWSKRVINDEELQDKLNKLSNKVINSLSNYLLIELVIPEQKQLIELSRAILEKYDELKFERGIFTYDDILFYTYRDLHNIDVSIIEKNSVLNQFYEKLSLNIRFILIDEFQDTSIIQWNILYPLISELLSGSGQKEYSGVVVVGDEKQSIFGWRDAERDLLLKISEFINLEKEPIKLKHSYRSRENIINFVNELFGNEQFLDELSQNNIENWKYDELIPLKNKANGYVELNLRNRAEKGSGRRGVKKRVIYEEFIRDRLKPLLQNNKLNITDTAILARTNKALGKLALVLDKYDIPYVLEATKSIFEHKAIKPIIFLMRYYVYNDIYEFLKFLRSDLILINPAQIKELLLSYKDLSNNNSQFNNNLFLEHNSDNEVINKIKQIFLQKYSKPLHFIKAVLEYFNIPDIFSYKNDLKNIYRFIEITSEFEENSDFSNDVKGFVNFCHKNRKSDDYKQVHIKEPNAINLITIHKSKGLQFDTVILFLDLSRSRNSRHRGLDRFFLYGRNFNDFKELWLTYNYQKIIRESDKNYLYKENQERKIVEVLDTNYVALTRAKNNLFINAYFKRKVFDSFFKEIHSKKNKLRTQRLLFSKFYFNNYDNFKLRNNYHKTFSKGRLQSNLDIEKVKTEENNKDIFKYFTLKEEYRVNEEWNVPFNKAEKKVMSLLLGNIAHHYLALIKFYSPDILDSARYKTVNKYATLLEEEFLDSIIDKIDQHVKENMKYFDKSNWDLVFNEYSIFDSTENAVNEYRIDRLLINQEKKKAFVIDYKTGDLSDIYQIEKYINILSNLPYFKENKFDISGDYFYLKLS
ncbi:MAG: UvrD-helicase domain-containing protein [Candidatus Cloacimonetes bacterium]|nr:UvrD-helicase domain-containing protein [Candidatus Cloacimonadota bacterium]